MQLLRIPSPSYDWETFLNTVTKLVHSPYKIVSRQFGRRFLTWALHLSISCFAGPLSTLVRQLLKSLQAIEWSFECEEFNHAHLRIPPRVGQKRVR
jgi:hypothetical protein